jgi:hypothetical protein
MTTTDTRTEIDAAVAGVVRWLETGEVSDGLFADDVFLDLTLPHWRVQLIGADAVVAGRKQLHPFPGQVRVERVDRTEHGFAMAFEERWHHDGQDWYCREQIRADVVGGSITDTAVYCTGDWDEAAQARHAAEVVLIRP